MTIESGSIVFELLEYFFVAFFACLLTGPPLPTSLQEIPTSLPKVITNSNFENFKD